jgi:ribonuclease VapC
VSSGVVLDASALLAVAHREPGAEQVLARSRDAVISAVNLAEVYSKLAQRGLSADAISSGLRHLVAGVIPFDEPLAMQTALLHARTREHGLALADCACLALGQWLDKPVLTADRRWAEVPDCGKVELIR